MLLTQKITKAVNDFCPNETEETKLELILSFTDKNDSFFDKYCLNPSTTLEEEILEQLQLFLTYELYVFDK